MRCTRCDGLVIPQAVGIAPDGKVVFGWCCQCLADKGCRLVEISAAGLWDLKLTFTSNRSTRSASSESFSSSANVDQSQWIIAVVAFLLISWGLILLTAGLFARPRSFSEVGPPGNGSSALLGIGGGVTALLGLGLLVLAARRNWFPGSFLLALLSWLSLLIGLGMIGYGIFDYQPRRNLPLALGSGVAFGISAVALLLERSQKRKAKSASLSVSWMPASNTGRTNAGGTKRLH
jgi:hypothetical protein